MRFQDDATRPPWEEAPETAQAVSALPLSLSFREVESPHTPEGGVAIGTFHSGRMISRFAAPGPAVADTLDRLTEGGAYLLLAAREKDEGIDGRLNALVPYERARQAMEAVREASEPWRASVADGDWQDSGKTPRFAALPLGVLVRVPGDRKHPDSLEDETRDMLARIVQGELHEIVDRLLDDL